MQKVTKRQFKKLQRIIGDLEALQRDVPDDNAWLCDAKSKLLKYEHEAYVKYHYEPDQD